MLVRNESNGQMIDTDANEQGEARFDFATAWDVAHMIEVQRVRVQYYKNSNASLRTRMTDAQRSVMDLRNSTHAFVSWLGDQSSQHAKDNDLCANYERFLTGVLGGYVSDDKTNDDARELARTFVRHASRVREYEVTVQRTSRTVGRDANTWKAQSDAAQNTDPYSFFADADNVTEYVLSDYDEVQARNESFARRGNYEIVSPRPTTNSESGTLPRQPYDGQRARDERGALMEWCVGCDVWHEA